MQLSVGAKDTADWYTAGWEVYKRVTRADNTHYYLSAAKLTKEMFYT